MSEFVHHLLARHSQPQNNVRPSLKSRFESDQSVADFSNHIESLEEEQATALPEALSFPRQDTDPGQEPHLPTTKQAPANARQKTAAESTTKQERPALIRPQLPPAITANQQSHIDGMPKQESSPTEREVIQPIFARQIKSHPIETPTSNTAPTSNSIAQREFPFFGQQRSETNTDEHGLFGVSKSALDSHLMEFNGIQSAPPTIKVSIGRIEVRANLQASPPSSTPTRTRPKPKMSLEDYLKKRNGKP